MPKIPLNQVLYGPLGTGKTYSSTLKALEILKEYKLISKIPTKMNERQSLFDSFRA